MARQRLVWFAPWGNISSDEATCLVRVVLVVWVS